MRTAARCHTCGRVCPCRPIPTRRGRCLYQCADCDRAIPAPLALRDHESTRAQRPKKAVA